MDIEIFNQKQLFTLEENSMLMDFLPFLYKDIFFLTNIILKEKEEIKLMEALKLLQALLIAIPKEYHDFIMEGIKQEQDRMLENNEIVLSFNLEYLKQLLNAFSLSLEIEVPKIEIKEEVQKSSIYNMEKIRKYETYYFEIWDITKTLISIWIHIIESKRKKESKKTE